MRVDKQKYVWEFSQLSRPGQMRTRVALVSESWQARVYLLSFVETPRKFIIAELSIRKLGSSSVLIMMKIRAYGSKALQ